MRYTCKRITASRFGVFARPLSGKKERNAPVGVEE